jgi:hypothetical protein
MRGAERERYELGVDTEKAHFAALTAALAAFGDGARKATAGFGDQDTPDVFTEVSRGIDKEQSHLHREFSRRDKLDCSSEIIALGKLEKPRLSARFSPPEPGSPAAGPFLPGRPHVFPGGRSADRAWQRALRHRPTRLPNETVALPIAPVLFKFET